MKRFDQNLKTKLIGNKGQLKLNKAKVCLVGLGGTGCPIFVYLHNAGVENICSVDDDRVEESNLNRQFIYNEDDVGNKKVDVILEKYGHNMKFDGKSMKGQISVVENSFQGWLEFLKKHDENPPKFDLIIEATDNFETKKAVQEFAFKQSIPCLICGVHGYQINMFAWHPKYSKNRYADLINCDDNISEKSEGTFPTATGILGTLVANEAIKILLELHEKVIYNRIWFYDILHNQLKDLKISV